MSILKRILGGAEEDTAEKKPATRVSGMRPRQRPDEEPSAAIDETRQSTRVALTAQDFAQRADMRRAGHSTTRDRFDAKIVTDGILATDKKFQAMPDIVKEHFKRLIFDLTIAARKQSEDAFYQKFDEAKRKLYNSDVVLKLLLSSLSTWMVGEQFSRGHTWSKRPNDSEPFWTVTSCSSDALLLPKPTVTAQTGNRAQVRVPLWEVFHGLKKL